MPANNINQEGLMTPTGLGIRNDAGGSGQYGAPRTRIVDGKSVAYKHAGVDYKCIPGQTIWMPFTGKIVRYARPYADGPYSGVLIEGKRLTVKMFYFEPYREIIGHTVKIGFPIGKAQDISQKYTGSGVTPHIHVQVEGCDPEFFFSRACDFDAPFNPGE